MRFTGDFHKLKEWEALFKTAPELMGPLSQDAAEETLLLVQETFRRQSDPYGIRWPPKKRSDGRAVLTGKTSRLRSGWHIERRGKFAWAIAPSVKYAAAHQDPRPRSGWGKRPGSMTQLPRRAMVPYRGLPDEWREAGPADGRIDPGAGGGGHDTNVAAFALMGGRAVVG